MPNNKLPVNALSKEVKTSTRHSLANIYNRKRLHGNVLLHNTLEKKLYIVLQKHTPALQA